MKNFVETIREIVGDKNVLTEPEDLYVYSFEGPLGLRRGCTPTIVVRLNKNREILKEVLGLAKKYGFHVLIRGEETVATQPQKQPILLVDVLDYVDGKALRESLRKQKPKFSETIRNMLKRGSWLSYMVSELSKRVVYSMCMECSRNKGTSCSGFCIMTPFYNGVETWSSKGRLILVRGLMADELKITKKLIDVVYSCTLCGQCYGQCFQENLEINKAFLKARKKIVDEGHVPEKFKELPKNILERSNPTGLTQKDRVSWIKDLPEKIYEVSSSEVLYWVGCTTSFRLPNVAKATIRLLNVIGVKPQILGEKEGCCGLPLINTGFLEKAKENATKNVEKLKKSHAKILVTGCAGCYYAFKNMYPEFLDLEVPMEVLHTSQFIEELINKEGLEFKEFDRRVTWHDPCDLGRHSNVYEPPRNLLKNIPNLKFTEMSLNRENARCCGGGGSFLSFNDEIAMKIAEQRVLEDAIPLNVDTIVTSCPTCQINLSWAVRRLKRKFRFMGKKNIGSVEVLDLTELLERSLSLGN